MCFGKIIIELKAQIGLVPVDLAQVIDYLKASKFRVGLIFNFGNSLDLEKKRVVI